MTIVTTWYREQFDEVWCAADTRISSKEAILTDSGPKILPIPVITHLPVDGGPKWIQKDQFSLGFVYAGNNLSAVSTHALASACTQNLAYWKAFNKSELAPPSVEAVAELFRKVAQHYIIDISSNMVGSQVDPRTYFFQAHIFGYCRASMRYRAFVISPELEAGKLLVNCSELALTPGMIFLLGSGTQEFIEISEELKRAGKTTGPIPALREMLRRCATPGVGGYFQCGIASRPGFNLCPILNIGGPHDRDLTFLGLAMSSLGEVEGYQIGFHAFSPDVD